MDSDKVIGSLSAWFDLFVRVFWWVVGAFAGGYALGWLNSYGGGC